MICDGRATARMKGSFHNDCEIAYGVWLGNGGIELGQEVTELRMLRFSLASTSKEIIRTEYFRKQTMQVRRLEVQVRKSSLR